MPYNIILYFRLPYFHVSNYALFSTWYFNTLILYRRSLDTFYWFWEIIIHYFLRFCSVDTFYEPDDFGTIEAVTIGHDNTGDRPDWDFEKVGVY